MRLPLLIYAPSWDPISLMRMSFDRKGEPRPLAAAKAGPADAYKQLPIKREVELAPVVTPRRPPDGRIPRNQQFGPAAAR